jgi:hypothetical protein
LEVSGDRLTVELGGTSSPSEHLTVFDAAGHLVRSGIIQGSEATVDLGGIPRGVYVVSVGHQQGKFFRD